MTRPGIEPRSPGPLANTLPTRPMSRLYIYIYIKSHQGNSELESTLSWWSSRWNLVRLLLRYLSLPPSRQDLTQGQWPEGWIIVGIRGVSLVHLKPDEPNMVLAWMPDYSLNWTARSSAIQRWQRCQCCSLLTWKWPNRSREPFGLLGMDHFSKLQLTHPKVAQPKPGTFWPQVCQGRLLLALQVF